MPGTPLEITGVVCSFLLPVEGVFVGILLKETAVKCFYLLQQHNFCWNRWQCELICDRKILSFSWGHGFALYELKNQEKADYFLKATFPSLASWSQFSLYFCAFLKVLLLESQGIRVVLVPTHLGTTEPCTKLETGKVAASGENVEDP